MKRFLIIALLLFFFLCTIVYLSQKNFVISWWVEDIFQNSMPQKLSDSMYGIMKTLNKNGTMVTYPICLELENQRISLDLERTTYIIWKSGKGYFQIDSDKNVIESRPLPDNLYPFEKLQKTVDLMVQNEAEIYEKNVYLIKFYSDTHFEIYADNEKNTPATGPCGSRYPGIYECERINEKWYFSGEGIDQKFDEENGIKRNKTNTPFPIDSLKKWLRNILH